MARRWLVAALGMLLLTAASALGAEERLLGVHYVGDLPTRVAESQGLFRRHGVDIAVRYGESGRANLSALRSGEAAFALMAETPVVLSLAAPGAGSRPDDPVILANLAHSDRLNHVVTLAGRGVREPADLGGRRVALPAGTNAAFLWYLFRAYHGLEAEAGTLIDAAPSRLGDLLLAGEADAAVLWEPWTSRLRARAGDALRVLPGSELYTAKWLLVTQRDLAQQRPKLCRAVLAAYRDAVRWIGRHRSAALELYLARSTRGQDGLAEAWKGVLFDLSLDWTLLAGLQQQVEWVKAAGLMPAALDPDLLAHIDAGPLRALAPERVHMPAGALDQSETDP